MCILLGLNNCFAQEFNLLRNAEFYPDNSDNQSIIPLKNDQAVLVFAYQPLGNLTDQTVVKYANIVPSVKRGQKTVNSVGWYQTISLDGEYLTEYSLVVDAQSVYVRSNVSDYLSSTILPQVQDILSTKNLGLVSQRKLLIDTYNGGLVKPTDFRGYLQPWIVSGLVIAILIPAWYLMRRFLRG